MTWLCDLCAANLQRLGRGKEIARLPVRGWVRDRLHRAYGQHMPAPEAGKVPVDCWRCQGDLRGLRGLRQCSCPPEAKGVR